MSALPQAASPTHTPGTGASGRWTVVPEASQARFHVRDKLVTTVHGTLPVVDGTIGLSGAGNVEQACVSMSIAGIATGNARRDKSLVGAGFLDAAHQPTLTITVDTATMTPTGCRAAATVLARGVHAPVDLTVDLVDGPMSGSHVRIRVSARLDRLPLGIKAPRALVGRFVDLDADLTFQQVPLAELPATPEDR